MVCNIQNIQKYTKKSLIGMVSEMRLINNNKCLSKLKCLQNIFHTNVMNDVSTFYLDEGFCPTHAKK